MRISDWGSDVCSSDLLVLKLLEDTLKARTEGNNDPRAYELREIGELALKLYASNVDHPLRRTRALDLIDRLVEDGLMGMQKLEARSEERRVGKECVVRVDLGGRRLIKKKKKTNKHK